MTETQLDRAWITANAELAGDAEMARFYDIFAATELFELTLEALEVASVATAASRPGHSKSLAFAHRRPQSALERLPGRRQVVLPVRAQQRCRMEEGMRRARQRRARQRRSLCVGRGSPQRRSCSGRSARRGVREECGRSVASPRAGVQRLRRSSFDLDPRHGDGRSMLFAQSIERRWLSRRK